MKKSEQKLRALVKFLGTPAGIEIADVVDMLDELTLLRKQLSKVKNLLTTTALEEMSNDEVYDLLVKLRGEFDEED